MKKLLLILLCLPMIGFGQQTNVTDDYIKISGTVIDELTSNPLPYVNFSTETNLGTISNIDGRVVFKYPKEFINSSLYISSIGYKTSIVTLPEVDTEDMSFSLMPDTFNISEVTVMPLKGKDIIAMAIENIPNNYHDSIIFMDVFYRKILNTEMSLELRSKEFYFRDIPINMLKEAALTMKKLPVKTKSKKDLLRVNAFRREREKDGGADSIITLFKEIITPHLDSLERTEFDSVAMVLVEDLYNQTLSKDDTWEFDQFDLIGNRKGHAVLSNKGLKKQIFELGDIVRYNDRQTYVINTSPKSCKKACYFKGEIYIDVESYAFVKEHYFLPECDKCFEEAKLLGMTRKGVFAEVDVIYKKYKSFWGLSHFSYRDIQNRKIGKLMFAPLYLVLKLKGQLKKELKHYFPRALYFRRAQTIEFFVNDIYTDDEIGFGGDNTMEETVVDEINADNKDIWGKYNYLEHPIENKNKK